ncbi:MAG: hypothetical protein F6K26_28965 [Moorea sp. SIO2I5]|nr:hypothetical protein [Moorena sp. SIO2I5]
MNSSRVGILPARKDQEPASCLVEWASWWHGHLGGTGILVARASWWHGHLGGTGILVARASWWHGHLARYNLRAGRIPTLLLFIP